MESEKAKLQEFLNGQINVLSSELKQVFFKTSILFMIY